MAFADPTMPNLPDFILFCQTQGVEVGYLPVTSDWYVWALNYAETIVNYIPQVDAIRYVIAVYNLGMHWLAGNAPDVTATNASLAWASSVVTVTTTAALGLAIGESFNVTISGASPAGYNGSFQATVTGASTFTYPLASDPGVATSAGSYTLQFFSGLRSKFNLLAFSPGPISSSSDQGTSEANTISDFMKQLTFSDLEAMLTPWGRRYLDYAQKYGPTIVELS